jgi:uncharacterized protein (TIGR02284 family)
MTMSNRPDSDSLSTLQDLLSINIDSQRGFEEAAKDTNDPQLKQMFMEYGQKRAQNAAELRQYIMSAGEQPSNSGSVTAAIHRWWIDAKQALTGNDAQSVLNEAERGEDSIKNTYQRALDKISDSTARAVVERQYSNVRDGHDRIRDMRDAQRLRNPRS